MAPKSGAHPILYDGFFTLVLRLANMAAMLAVGVLTARLLGPAGKGIYALPLVQAGLVSTAFTGLSSTTTYYLLNRNAGRRVVAPSLWAALFFTVIAAVAVLPVAYLGNAMWAAPAAIASLPAVAAVNVVTGYVIGIRRVRYATTVTLLTTLATFAFSAAGLFAIARTPAVAILAWIASTTIIAAVALGAMLVHARRLPAGEPVAIKPYVAMSTKVGLTGLVSLLNYRADLYTVAVLLPPFELGLYSVASSIPQGLLVPTQVAALVTSPHIASLDKKGAARLAARCVRNNLIVASALCAVLFAVAPWLVQLLYGNAFLPLVPALRVLLVGVVVLSLGSPVSSYYTLKLAKPEIPLVLAAISAAICIAGCVILVPRIGIVGAATSSTAAYILGQGLGLWYFARTASLPMRDLLVPTLADVKLYGDFVKRALADAALFLHRKHPETTEANA